MKKKAPTWYANIWIAGDYARAVDACFAFCADVGLCVTVTRTTYVHSDGKEEGVCVRLINYPRFAEGAKALKRKAEALAEDLKIALNQDSYSIEYPDVTLWVTTRPQDEAS